MVTTADPAIARLSGAARLRVHRVIARIVFVMHWPASRDVQLPHRSG